MKTAITTLCVLLVVAACAVCFTSKVKAADERPTEYFEYATLRWGGRENTHVIRPSGNVEFLGSQFNKIKRTERVDERSFYMNIAMNALAKEGYELAAMTPDDYVMKRKVKN